MANKDEIIFDTQAIVSIVAGTASILQEYTITVFTRCICPKCSRTYWKLVINKQKYLQLYPYCPNCGQKIQLENIIEDPDVIGCEAIFLMKNGDAYASFRLTEKALKTPNIKQMLQKCDAKFIE